MCIRRLSAWVGEETGREGKEGGARICVEFYLRRGICPRTLSFTTTSSSPSSASFLLLPPPPPSPPPPLSRAGLSAADTWNITESIGKYTHTRTNTHTRSIAESSGEPGLQDFVAAAVVPDTIVYRSPAARSQAFRARVPCELGAASSRRYPSPAAARCRPCRHLVHSI